jgi:hypothetical protein
MDEQPTLLYTQKTRKGKNGKSWKRYRENGWGASEEIKEERVIFPLSTLIISIYQNHTLPPEACG